MGDPLYFLYERVFDLIQGWGIIWEFIFTPFYMPLRIPVDFSLPLIVPAFYIRMVGPVPVPAFTVITHWFPIAFNIPLPIANIFNNSFLGGLSFGLLLSTPTLIVLIMLRFVKKYTPFL